MATHPPPSRLQGNTVNHPQSLSVRDPDESQPCTVFHRQVLGTQGLSEAEAGRAYDMVGKVSFPLNGRKYVITVGAGSHVFDNEGRGYKGKASWLQVELREMELGSQRNLPEPIPQLDFLSYEMMWL